MAVTVEALCDACGLKLLDRRGGATEITGQIKRWNDMLWRRECNSMLDGTVGYLPDWLVNTGDKQLVGYSLPANLVIASAQAVGDGDAVLRVMPTALLAVPLSGTPWQAFMRVCTLLGIEPLEFTGCGLAPAKAESDGEGPRDAWPKQKRKRGKIARAALDADPAPRRLAGLARVQRDVRNNWLPTLPFLFLRLAICAGSNQPRTRHGEWQRTSYGEAAVCGKFGGWQLVCLSALCRAGEPEMLPQGGVRVTTTLRRLCSAMGLPKSSRPLQWIEDLHQTTVAIRARATTGLDTVQIDSEHILIHKRLLWTHRGGSENLVGPHSARRRREAPAGALTIQVTLGPVFMSLWEKDFCLYDTTSTIAAYVRMRSGIARLAAAFLKTQSRWPGTTEKCPLGQYKLDTLVGILNPGLNERIQSSSPAQRSKALAERAALRRAFRKDSAVLSTLGFQVEGDRVVRRDPPADTRAADCVATDADPEVSDDAPAA